MEKHCVTASSLTLSVAPPVVGSPRRKLPWECGETALYCTRRDVGPDGFFTRSSRSGSRCAGGGGGGLFGVSPAGSIGALSDCTVVKPAPTPCVSDRLME